MSEYEIRNTSLFAYTQHLIGGTGIPSLSDVASIQYHVGIVKQ